MTIKLEFQDDLVVEQGVWPWIGSWVPVPLVDGRQSEADVEAWLAAREQSGSLVILKRYLVGRAWGDSRAWTIGVVFRPYTERTQVELFGDRPLVVCYHVQEHRVPNRGRTDPPRVWTFFAFKPGDALEQSEAPNEWNQDAWEVLRCAGGFT